MKLTTITILAVLGASVGVAQADGNAGDCPKPYRPKRPRPPRRPPVKPPLPLPCDCVGTKGVAGEQGPVGPQGPKGDVGSVIVNDNSVTTLTVNQTSPLKFRVGAMGAIYGRHGDWAWGPALQIGTQLTDRTELVLDGGLALGLDGDHETGLLLHAGVAHYLIKNVGLTAGLHSTSINGSTSNGNLDGDYLSLSLGFTVRSDEGRFRLEVAPTIGGLRDGTAPDDSRFAMGLTSSVFVGF